MGKRKILVKILGLVAVGLITSTGQSIASSCPSNSVIESNIRSQKQSVARQESRERRAGAKVNQAQNALQAKEAEIQRLQTEVTRLKGTLPSKCPKIGSGFWECQQRKGQISKQIDRIEKDIKKKEKDLKEPRRNLVEASNERRDIVSNLERERAKLAQLQAKQEECNPTASAPEPEPEQAPVEEAPPAEEAPVADGADDDQSATPPPVAEVDDESDDGQGEEGNGDEVAVVPEAPAVTPETPAGGGPEEVVRPPAASEGQTGPNWKYKKNQVNVKYHDDDCSNSKTISDDRTGCSTSKTTMTVTNALGVAGQIAGSVTTELSGNSEAREAATEGNISAGLKSSSKKMKAAGTAQLSQGALNSGAGAFMMLRAYQHYSDGKDHGKAANEDQIQLEADVIGTKGNYFKAKAAGEGSEVVQQTINSFKLNKKHQIHNIGQNAQLTDPEAEEAKQKLYEEMKGDIAQKNANAQREQSAMAEQSFAFAMASLAKGAQQIITGVALREAADELDEAAEEAPEELPTWDFQQGDPVAGPPPAEAPDGGFSGGNSGAGDLEVEQLGLTEEDDEDVVSDGIGGPAFPEDFGPIANAPTPGQKVAGNSGAGGGGGSPASFGASSLPSTARPEDGEGAPTPASEDDGTRYGGGAAGRGYASSGGGAGGGGSGLDLSSLLAQFLPKEGDEKDDIEKDLKFGDQKQGRQFQGILGRNSMGLFKRVSLKYNKKERARSVGSF